MPKQLSVADVKYEIDNLRSNLFLEEKEDTWEKIGKSIASLIKICEHGGYDANPTELVAILRSAHRPIISAMNSERTRLCLIPLELVGTLASTMGGEFEQLLSLFMQPLLTLCARTNKVIVNRARACVFSVVEYTQAAVLLSYFMQNIKDKSNTLKLVVVEGALACLNSCNPPDIEKEPRIVEIEAIIRASARDASADVRKISRKMFESYQILFPARVNNFIAPLSPTTKKYLDIKLSAAAPRPMPTSKPAATRAKAETKPTTMAATAKPSSSRVASSTLSTGTLNNQVRTTSSTMARVTKKQPAPGSSAPSAQYAPVRSVESTKSTSEIQKTTTQRTIAPTSGPVRMTSFEEEKRPAPPVRSQSVTASRVAASSSATNMPPSRLQLNSAKPIPTASGSQPVPSGPRRVPMPESVPAPAPPKEKEGPKRPASRVDNATSTRQRPVIPVAPIKKKPVAVAPSLKDRPPTTATHATTKSTASALPVPSASSSTTTTTVGGRSTTTKPVVVAKPKPQWGRSAPAPKPVPKPASGAPQKPVASGLGRKPSTRVPSKATAGPPKIRPVTPAMVALPPSPTPEEEGAVVPSEVTEETTAEKQIKVEETEVELEPRVESQLEEAVEETKPVSPSYTPEPVIKQEEIIKEEEIIEQPVPTKDDSAPTTPLSANGEDAVTLRSEEANEDDASSVHSSNTNQAPQTPQHLLPLPASNEPSFSSKTPISALLSSIEQGFAFSPITPLSPADLYLNPNNTTPYVHQQNMAPRQPFNYALHAPSANGVFAGFAFADVKKRDEDMVRGDLGVIKVSDHNKLFSQVGLDDATSRQAFLQLNQ